MAAQSMHGFTLHSDCATTEKDVESFTEMLGRKFIRV